MILIKKKHWINLILKTKIKLKNNAYLCKKKKAKHWFSKNFLIVNGFSEKLNINDFLYLRIIKKN